jgi:hypothetical protein
MTINETIQDYQSKQVVALQIKVEELTIKLEQAQSILKDINKL